LTKPASDGILRYIINTDLKTLNLAKDYIMFFMKRCITVLITIFVLGSCALAQDTGITDTIRFEPENSTWYIDSEQDTLFTLEVWGFTDQNVLSASLGFSLTTSTGGGTGHDDSLMVADTFDFGPDITGMDLIFRKISLDPEYDAWHYGFNGFLLGIVNFFDIMMPLNQPNLIGEVTLRVFDPAQLPVEFEITIDSSFVPPAATFKFSPGRRSPRSGYPPYFSAATIQVVNSLGEPLVPEIGFEPSSVTFNCVGGGPNPDPRPVSIFNAGEGLLEWSVEDNADWLWLSPTEGVDDGVCSLFVDIGELAVGSYNAQVMITDPGASNSPQYIPVTLSIAEESPVIELDPTVFYFDGIEGDSLLPIQFLSISNAAKSGLNWTATDDADWLTLSPMQGSGSGVCTLYVDATALSVGYYSSVITVSDPDASNNPQTAQVYLSIYPPFGGYGDDCNDPIVLNIPDDLPYSDGDQTTCERYNTYDQTCLGYYDGGEDIVYQLNVGIPIGISIQVDPKGTPWVGMVLDNSCPPDPTDCIAIATSSSPDLLSIDNVILDPGTYYIMVDTWPSPDCIPEFNLYIDEALAPGAGDDCYTPIDISIPAQLPYTDGNNFTCGRGNNYSNTCLGYYDGGEDIVYHLEVTEPSVIMLMLDPKGTPWAGMLIDDECPADPTTCIASVHYDTQDGPIMQVIDWVELDVGDYYIMVDTWPSPNCIQDFDLYVTIPIGHFALLNPDPAYMYYMFAVDPIIAEVELYVAKFVETALVNGLDVEIYPDSIAAYRLKLPIKPFLEGYGTPVGSSWETLSVTGQYTDGSQYDVEGYFELHGKNPSNPAQWILPPDDIVLHGDVNASGALDIDDVVAIIGIIFQGQMVPGPMLIADCDCSRSVDIDDVVRLIGYIFANGERPCEY